MKLINNIKKAHKLWSVQSGTVAAVAMGVEVVHQKILPLYEGIVPDGTLAAVGATFAAASVVLRLFTQPKLGIYSEDSRSQR